MRFENELLLASAARLYTLGLDVEGAREELRQLVERGVPLGSPEVRAALNEFLAFQDQFTRLEQEHRRLRDEL